MLLGTLRDIVQNLVDIELSEQMMHNSRIQLCMIHIHSVRDNAHNFQRKVHIYVCLCLNMCHLGMQTGIILSLRQAKVMAQ